jgi:hypothetical protein
VVTIISPLLVGVLWRKHEIRNLSKAGMLWCRKTCLVVLNRGLASLENNPRELVFPANLGILSI